MNTSLSPTPRPARHLASLADVEPPARNRTDLLSAVFRRAVAEFWLLVRFFTPSVPKITELQRQTAERRQLALLARRATLWGTFLFPLSVLVLVFGAEAHMPVTTFWAAHSAKYPDASWPTVALWVERLLDQGGYSLRFWAGSLWCWLAAYIFILQPIARLEPNASVRTQRVLYAATCVWIVGASLWWLSAFWVLQYQEIPKPGVPFLFGQRMLIMMTMLGTLITVVLLAVRPAAIVAALWLGFMLPFWLCFKPVLFPDPTEATRFFPIIMTANFVAYTVVGLFHANVIRRTQERAVLLEAERFRANNFISRLAHDLRQHLATVALNARRFADGRAPSTTSDWADASDAMLRMSETINQTLYLSKVEAGNQTLAPCPEQLPARVEAVVADFRGLAIEKNIDIVLCTLPRYVCVDRTAFDRILLNYIANALKYSPPGTQDAHCRVFVECTAKPGRTIRVAVTNFGPIIPEDKQSKVFEPFIQLGNPEHSSAKGLGLGLAIVHGFAELSEFRYGVHSSAEAGTCFWVDIPDVGAIPPAALEQRHTESTVDADLSGMTVYLVEDEIGPRSSLAATLKDLGCAVYAGASPEEVLDQRADVAQAPDFIISDYRLREGKTGLDAIQTLRARSDAYIPGAIWTGEVMPETERRIQDAGLVLMHKPVDVNDLAQLLQEHYPLSA